ncbi:MAG: archease [Dehalococcoidia bacterium]|nr:MAG: archease [Dehalococcoidia bacterium]
MPRYRLIPHTADAGLYAYGKTLDEAFANAAYGMFAVMTDLRKVRETEERRISITEKDKETLLFEWLNRLLYLFDVEQLLFKRFEVALNGTHLTATCYGEKFDPERHEMIIGVKSATYYTLEVRENKPRVRVVFDV